MSEAYTGDAPAALSVSRCAGEPLFQNHCQCLDCQHQERNRATVTT